MRKRGRKCLLFGICGSRMYVSARGSTQLLFRIFLITATVSMAAFYWGSRDPASTKNCPGNCPTSHANPIASHPIPSLPLSLLLSSLLLSFILSFNPSSPSHPSRFSHYRTQTKPDCSSYTPPFPHSND